VGRTEESDGNCPKDAGHHFPSRVRSAPVSFGSGVSCHAGRERCERVDTATVFWHQNNNMIACALVNLAICAAASTAAAVPQDSLPSTKIPKFNASLGWSNM
jgi:hypothetical protein